MSHDHPPFGGNPESSCRDRQPVRGPGRGGARPGRGRGGTVRRPCHRSRQGRAGGPTRRRVRVYAHARSPGQIKQLLARGFTAFKTGPAKRRPSRYLESPAEVRYTAEQFAALRKAAGDDVDLAIDFHGAVSPALAKVLIKALEPYSPMFIEEPVNCQNHDVMAEIARGTHLPIATGERVFTKWGFREVLEKRAATILQPDLCHAGGITEVRLIAGLAEAYYASIAPPHPLGHI